MRLAGPPSVRRSRVKSRGFTLVELMAVVTITGILATVGTLMVRKYFAQAKTAEAVAIIQSIRVAEESRRAETGNYLSCSSPNETAWYPAAPNGSVRAWRNPSHADWARWQLLGVTRTDGTRFGFLLTAGAPGATPPTLVTASQLTWPTSLPDPWYVIQAAGDNDKDGIYTLVAASSLNGELYVENDGE